MAPKRRIALLLLSCLVILAGMAATSYWADPAGLFARRSVENDIAEHITAGRALEIFGNINERAFQKRRLELESLHDPDYLVLGSSRAMLPGGWLFGGSAVNVAVPGATLEDLVALLEMSAAIRPRTYVLGVDPWLFNRNNNQNSWQVLGAAYRRGLERIGAVAASAATEGSTASAFAASPLLQLVNLEYFRESVKKLRQKENTALRYQLVDASTWTGSGLLVRPDGSRGYRHQVRTAGEQEQVNRTAGAETKPFGLKQFVALDVERLAIFRKLAAHLRRNGPVILLLMPYHPAAWQHIGRLEPVIAAEVAIHALAKELDLQVAGSFSPDRAGCPDKTFVDYMHPDESCLLALWRRRAGH